MIKKSEDGITPIDMGGQSEIERLERNLSGSIYALNQRILEMERTMRMLSHHVASFEDALTHIARIPDYPLELEYDHRTNTLWAQTRRKLEFNKNEAVVISKMFTKNGKPKRKIFQCSEVAAELSEAGEGINSAKAVSETAKRIQRKLDDFLNTHEVIVVSTKSFYFSKIALE